MKVFVAFPPEEEKQVETRSKTPLGFLDERRLPPDMYITVINGVPAPIDQPLNDGDRLTFISVASGG